MIGRDAVGADGLVRGGILERTEVLEFPRGEVEPVNERLVRIFHPYLAVHVGKVGRHERLLGGIGLPLLRNSPGLEGLGLLVEFRDAALIHQGDPHISVLVGLQVERAPREARF